MRTDAVVFDLDDTLFDETTFVDGALGDVAQFLATRTPHSQQEIVERLRAELARSGRGRVFDNVVGQLGLGEDLVPTLVYVYRRARPPIRLFEGVPDLFGRIHESGRRLGVLTDGSALVQGNKVEILGLPALVDAVVLSDAVMEGRPKPHTDAFSVVCELLDAAPGRVAYVGNDLRKDYLGPRRLGMCTIHVTHRELGAGQTPDGGAPDVVVPTVRDVWPLLAEGSKES